MSHARGATGVSLAALGVAFGLRALGDVNESFLSWLSPMGWSQQVKVYADNRWWPLLLSLAFCALLLVGTVLLESRRDLGAGVLAARPGPASASRSLSGVVGLTWRLQRASLAGWMVGVLAFGLLFGSFSESIKNMVADNPTLAEYFLQTGMNVVDAFFATALLLLGIVAAGFSVSSALRTRGEETADRLEPLLATATSRSRWLFGSLLVTLVGTCLVVLVGGFGVGLAYAMTAGSGADIGRMTAYSLVYLPPVLLLDALVVLLFGWLPRAAAATWAVVAGCFVIGWLGGLLKPPQWVENLSPFTHVPQVPAADVTAAPLAALLALTVAGVVVGWAGFLRRDIG
jgi:ABC-2 type transport system permease protein